MDSPVALVTGASSGIGLALTHHLLSKQWLVVMADLNSAADPLPENNSTLFIQTNVSSWSQQASLFSRAYAWRNRLDFCALNAGIDDRDDIFNSISSGPTARPPRQPNMKTLDVNFTGVYYGLKLAAHYLSLDSTAAGKARAGGKIVITASAAGLYPQTAVAVPQYAASKSALVGLVRAIAPMAAAKANIHVNADTHLYLHILTTYKVCPALVATKLAPPGLLESFSKAQLTPMSTILRCFDELACLDDVDSDTWVEMGPRGAIVEGSHEVLIYHEAPTSREEDGSATYLGSTGQEAWARVYTERNKNFARQGEEI